MLKLQEPSCSWQKADLFLQWWSAHDTVQLHLSGCLLKNEPQFCSDCWPQTENRVVTGGCMHTPHSRGIRGGRRGNPPHGWREPPGTQTPLLQTRVTALPCPLSSRHSLRLLAGGRVRLRGRRLVGPRLVGSMQTEWHSNLVLLLPALEATSLANTTMPA